MSDTVQTTLIETVPSLLWVAFATAVFFSLRGPLAEQIGRLRTASTPFGDFNFDIALTLVDQAAGSQQQKDAGTVPTASERRAVASRLDGAVAILDRGSILWVDDRPEGNASLIALFERVGMSVCTVRSTEAALTELNHRRFDLVITDLARPDDPTAGFHLAEEITVRGTGEPVILYAFDFDPRRGVHPGLFAYATSYDELIHLVIDVMERLRFNPPPSHSRRRVPARRG